MYETLKRLWSEAKITESNLNAAIAKGWITYEQKQAIISQ